MGGKEMQSFQRDGGATNLGFLRGSSEHKEYQSSMLHVVKLFLTYDEPRN